MGRGFFYGYRKEGGGQEDARKARRGVWLGGMIAVSRIGEKGELYGTINGIRKAGQ